MAKFSDALIAVGSVWMPPEFVMKRRVGAEKAGPFELWSCGCVAATKQQGVQSADEADESLGLRYGDKVPLAGHRRKHQKGGRLRRGSSPDDLAGYKAGRWLTLVLRVKRSLGTVVATR